MLSESKNIEQPEDGLMRRWFSDDYFDLIIWQNEIEEIVGFKLCYNRNVDEHAFVWRQHEGHVHLKVDDGEKSPDRHKMSPVLVADGRFERRAVLEKFRKAARNMDPGIVKFVCNKLDS